MGPALNRKDAQVCRSVPGFFLWKNAIIDGFHIDDVCRPREIVFVHSLRMAEMLKCIMAFTTANCNSIMEIKIANANAALRERNEALHSR